MIVPLLEIARKRKFLKKVVLVGGVFDIIHIGHIQHLKKAKSLGNTLVVHITGDKRVVEKKGKDRPILNEKERANIVAAIRFVDYVFIYNGRHYDQEVINAVRPNILFFNQEAFNKEVKESVKNLINFDGKILVDKKAKSNSSSTIIKKMLRLSNLQKI